MKIVVVGGVAAGMSLAARARRLDEHAEIVVFERDPYVSFANCGLPYHIGGVIEDRDALLLQTPESLHASLALDVRVGHEVLAIDPAAHTVTVRVVATGEVREESYDKLALCPGAEPVVPPLPGVEDRRVHTLRRMADMDGIKAAVDAVDADGDTAVRHAVVIGAGYIGLELAENLRHRGVDVALVELAEQVMPPLDRELSTTVERELRAHGVRLHLGAAAEQLAERADGRLEVVLTNGSRLPADLVALAVGVRPATGLAEAAGLELGPRGGIAVDAHQQTSVADVYAAGDAVEVTHRVLPGSWLIPLAGPANRQGRVAAEHMCGRPARFPSVSGAGVVKVFGLTAGGVGANERQLAAAGMAYDRVHLHPSGHAGYYPGTQAMHLKVLYDPADGRLLGAGVVGVDGVDKRLDVLATALQAGWTVYDLEELELAYAPPYGSAKDPVNMAGFIAGNVLRGDLRLWQAVDYPAAVRAAHLVDVRSAEEFAAWHIPGAQHVPLADLRARSADWDRATPIRLYCAVGFRSYLAYRALVGRGFADVATLSGGLQTFRAVHDLDPSPAVDGLAPLVAYAEQRTGPHAIPGGA